MKEKSISSRRFSSRRSHSTQDLHRPARSSGSLNSRKSVPIQVKAHDGKTITTILPKKAMKIIRCSDEAKGVHSCSYGHHKQTGNLYLTNNRGQEVTMTFAEASVMFTAMQQDEEIMSLFTSSSKL